MALSKITTEATAGMEARHVPRAVPARPTLRRNISWTFLGTGVWSACNWLMFIVLAKLSSTQTVGLYTYSIAIATPIVTFAQLNLRGLSATDANRDFRFSDYLTLRFVCMLIAFTLIATLTRVGARFPGAAWTLIWISLGIILDSFSDIFYGLLQRHEQMKQVGISMAVKGVLSLAALGLGIRFTHSLTWAVFFSALASAMIVLGYDLPCSLRLSRERMARSLPGANADAADEAIYLHWNFGLQKRLFWLALPMGFSMLLIALNMNVSRYFIEHYQGKHALAIFGALSYLVVAGRTAIIALGLSAHSRLGQYWAAGRRSDFRALTGKLMAICVVLGAAAPLVAFVVGHPLLTLLYKPEYARHQTAFVLILASGGLSYVASMLGYAITAARYIRIQILWFGIGTVVAIVTSWWLIPTHGLVGAAISALLSWGVQLIVGLFILRHLLQNFNPPKIQASEATL